MRPISITMVVTMRNQMMSKMAARSGGRTIGAVIRTIDPVAEEEEAEDDDDHQNRRQQFPTRQVHRDNRFSGRLRDVE